MRSHGKAGKAKQGTAACLSACGASYPAREHPGTRRVLDRGHPDLQMSMPNGNIKGMWVYIRFIKPLARPLTFIKDAPL